MSLADDITELLQWLLDFSKAQKCDLYVVGGYVRDLLLARVIDADVDLLLQGDAIRLGEVVAKEIDGTIKIFPHFGTAKVCNPKRFPKIREVDFASARAEIYEAPGKLPTVRPATVLDDLKRRDFTINAMAVTVSDFLNTSPWQEALLDPHGGEKDLLSKTIRIIHPKSFVDDPTRMFRAIRYEARIGGKLEVDTMKAFTEAVQSGALGTISRFRIFTELKKMCTEPDAALCLSLAHERGLLEKSLPISGKQVEACISVSALQSKGDKAYQAFLARIFANLNDKQRAELAKDLNIAQNKIPSL